MSTSNDGDMGAYFSPSPKSMSFQSSSIDDPISEGHINDEPFSAVGHNSENNANLLKDIENLIYNMERKQTQDADSMMLKNIDNILSNIKLNESRPHSPQSNLSAEPIRMKSPITLAWSRSDDKIKTDSRNIIDDVRNFVTSNIQDIVPALVGQVEHDLKNQLYDANDDPMDSNLADFLRDRHDVEFMERNVSSNEHKNAAQQEDETFSDFNDENNDLNDFWRERYDEEFFAANNEIVVSDTTEINNSQNHDNIINEQDNFGEILTTNEENNGSNDAMLVETQVEETTAVNFQELKTQTLPDMLQISSYRQLEPLKYNSSFNYKISKKAPKKSRRERNFKKRNSFLLENVLMGISSKSDKSEMPESIVLDGEIGESTLSTQPTESAVSTINHSSIMTENVESNSAPIQNEINIAMVGESPTASDSRNIINEIAQASEQFEGSSTTAAFENVSNQFIETTIETVVEIIINDEHEAPQHIVNGHDEYALASFQEQEIINEIMLPIPTSSSSVSLLTESDTSKAPQNLSELVEDTQRLIKQMKDEINAIYVSDEDYTTSEEDSEESYSGEWIDGMEIDGDEYANEGSDYDDWSGDYIETQQTDSYQEETLMEDSFVDDSNELNNNEANSELFDAAITGNSPTAVEVNETENAPSENVVHAKLELTPLSANQFKVDASFESDNELMHEFVNANDDNLNNVMSQSDAVVLQENQNDTQVTIMNVLSGHNEPSIISNDEIVPMNSITAIVNEVINDVISRVSLENDESIVSIGNDDNHSQITDYILEIEPDHDLTNIDSVINNSGNILTEVMPKVSDDVDNESITSGNMLSDVENAESVTSFDVNTISIDAKVASNSFSESDLSTNDGENSESLKNDDAVADGGSGETIPVEFNGETTASATTKISLITDVKSSEEKTEAQVGATAKSATMPDDNQITASTSKVQNPKPKGAIAKTKIPEKVKNNKLKIVKSKDASQEQQSEAAILEEEKTPKEIKQKSSSNSRKNSVNDVLKKSSPEATPRKKSMPGPFGLVLGKTSHVKNMQNQFLSKTIDAPISKTTPTKVRTSKLVAPKSLMKESTFANKLTKLITPSASAAIEAIKEAGAENLKLPNRDYSKDKVPNKKYMEHCFSDEYGTTDDEDERLKAPLQIFPILKRPTQDSDDETSDVRRILL